MEKRTVEYNCTCHNLIPTEDDLTGNSADFEKINKDTLKAFFTDLTDMNIERLGHVRRLMRSYDHIDKMDNGTAGFIRMAYDDFRDFSDMAKVVRPLIEEEFPEDLKLTINFI